MKCPKCDADVLTGDKKLPNHCPDCHYEWDKGSDPMSGEKNPDHKDIEVAENITRIPVLKSTRSLMTFNQDFRRPKIVDRIDNALEQLG